MKKVVALILAAMLALSFAACGEKEVSQTGDKTIVWYIPGDKQADSAAVMEAASKITMEKLGVKLDVQFIDTAAFSERMTMNFASGNDDFDLTFTGYINPYRDAVTKGAYLEISEYVEKSDIIKTEIPEYAIECAKVDGELYGLPNMQIMTNCTGLFVQKDLAEEYGLNTGEIKHLEDIENGNAKTIKKADFYRLKYSWSPKGELHEASEMLSDGFVPGYFDTVDYDGLILREIQFPDTKIE